MAKSKSFKENFIANKENEKKLQKVLEAASAEEISEAINNNVVDTLGYTMWSSIIALTNDEEKLFEILQEVSLAPQLASSVSTNFMILGSTQTQQRPAVH